MEETGVSSKGLFLILLTGFCVHRLSTSSSSWFLFCLFFRGTPCQQHVGCHSPGGRHSTGGRHALGTWGTPHPGDLGDATALGTWGTPQPWGPGDLGTCSLIILSSPCSHTSHSCSELTFLKYLNTTWIRACVCVCVCSETTT